MFASLRGCDRRLEVSAARRGDNDDVDIRPTENRGQIGVEIFISSGGVRGPETLQDLFSRFSD